MLKAAYILFSFRKELKYVLLTFVLILLLPAIAFIVLANSGIQAASDLLTGINPLTKQIQIFTPNGELYKTLDISVAWPTSGTVTQEFGESELPYYLFHTGIDIAGKLGDPITPAIKGEVVHTGKLSWGLGNHVIVDHGDNLTTSYGHMSQILVDKGDIVETGDVIGLQGRTGWSTGVHLHFEVRVFGIPVNPRVVL